MTASSNDGPQAGYWGGFDLEDAVDFTRAWLTDSPGPSRSQQLAAWLDTRQARIELLPTEAALEPGYIRLRHGTMQPDTFRLHAGQFFATGADTAYGYAGAPAAPTEPSYPSTCPAPPYSKRQWTHPCPTPAPATTPAGWPEHAAAPALASPGWSTPPSAKSHPCEPPHTPA